MGNIVVLFEVIPTKEGMERYLELAAMLKPLLPGFEGFKREGREKLIKSYSITVCSAIRLYSSFDRVYAPDDSNKALLR